MTGRISAAVLLLAITTAPAPAGEDPLPPATEATAALLESWFAAATGADRTAVEERARAVAPLRAEEVAPLSERLFALGSKRGPRLPAKARAQFYAAENRGTYLLKPGKKGGGLLVALHGNWKGPGDASMAAALWGDASAMGYTILCPEVLDWTEGTWIRAREERFVIDLLDAALRTTGCDTNRVVLAGYSLGGDGAWWIGGRHADLFAAVAPVAGGITPLMTSGGLNAPGSAGGEFEGLRNGVLPNLGGVAAWIYHSVEDNYSSIRSDDAAVENLDRLSERFPGRYVHRFERVTGNRNFSPKGGMGPALKWLEPRSRDPYPPEVVWETSMPTKTRFHWLSSRGHPEVTRFHARLAAPNEFEVTAASKPSDQVFTGNQPLTILLSPRMIDFTKPIRVTSAGKVLFQGLPPRTAWALLESIAARGDRNQWFEGHVTVSVPRKRWCEFWDEPVEKRK